DAPLLRRPGHGRGGPGARPPPADGGAQLDLRPHLAAPVPLRRTAGRPGRDGPRLNNSKKSWRVRTRHVALFPGRRVVRGAPMSAVPERAKSVFLRAVEMASEEERRAYLDAACRGDDALRREVEGLLAHHGRLGAFLEPAADPTGTGDFTPGGAPPGP